MQPTTNITRQPVVTNAQPHPSANSASREEALKLAMDSADSWNEATKLLVDGNSIVSITDPSVLQHACSSGNVQAVRDLSTCGAVLSSLEDLPTSNHESARTIESYAHAQKALKFTQSLKARCGEKVTTTKSNDNLDEYTRLLYDLADKREKMIPLLLTAQYPEIGKDYAKMGEKLQQKIVNLLNSLALLKYINKNKTLPNSCEVLSEISMLHLLTTGGCQSSLETMKLGDTDHVLLFVGRDPLVRQLNCFIVDPLYNVTFHNAASRALVAAVYNDVNVPTEHRLYNCPPGNVTPLATYTNNDNTHCNTLVRAIGKEMADLQQHIGSFRFLYKAGETPT